MIWILISCFALAVFMTWLEHWSMMETARQIEKNRGKEAAQKYINETISYQMRR